MNVIMGIERETHRMSADGAVSGLRQNPGLMPPNFTKDFAESQLEIVTSPHGSIPELLFELEALTERARNAVLPEVLWPFSMPPRLPPDPEIRIAELGAGKKAQEGMIYRSGLALRYGKPRQMICGVHLNVSIDDDPGPKDALYLRLARNLYADLPYLILLTGASPTLGGLSQNAHPPAVSYRNSGLGYAGAEYRPYLDLTSVESYVAGVRRGLAAESARFKALGSGDGARLQLNARVFQTEKEFYAPIRFKRNARWGETGLEALARGGVEYVELRFLDVDPFSPLGISEETLLLMHMFVLDGLMRPSGAGTVEELGRQLDAAETAAIADPSALKARGGAASPGTLESPAPPARMRLESLAPLARGLDRGRGDDYQAVLDNAIGRLACPARLPSARLSAALEDSGSDWTRFGMRIAGTRRIAV